MVLGFGVLGFWEFRVHGFGFTTIKPKLLGMASGASTLAALNP